MALSTTSRQTWHTGDDATTVYAYAYRISVKTELEVVTRVTATGVETTLTVDVDYTVSGVGVETGGNVTLTTALASTKVMTIRGKLPLTQTTDIRNQGAYYPYLHENGFDRAAQRDQQLQHEVNRSFKLPVTWNPSTYSTEVVPVAAAAIGFDSNLDLCTITSLGGTAVSAYMVTVLDDTSAAIARATLDASQLVSSMTAETAPIPTDYTNIIDVSESATAENKVLLSDLGKGITCLPSFATDAAFVTAKNSAAAAGDRYHNTTEAVIRWHNGTAWQSVFHVPIRPGMYGLTLEAATGSVAADTIRLTASDGADLSTDAHHGYAVVPHHTTAGLLSVFRVSANIDRLLTGAHWALDTLGDLTDVELRYLLINDAGTLKTGVSLKGGYRTVTTALSSATPSDINLQTEVLVSSTLTGTSPCIEVGHFLADFDDTGGSSENLWVVQTALGEINIGIPAKDHTDWESWTPTGTWSTNTTYTGRRRRVGDSLEIEVMLALAGAPTSANLAVDLPSGLRIDTGKLVEGTDNDACLGFGKYRDDGTGNGHLTATYSTTTALSIKSLDTGAANNVSSVQVTATAPVTWAANDQLIFKALVPIRHWSSN